MDPLSLAVYLLHILHFLLTEMKESIHLNQRKANEYLPYPVVFCQYQGYSYAHHTGEYSDCLLCVLIMNVEVEAGAKSRFVYPVQNEKKKKKNCACSIYSVIAVY